MQQFGSRACGLFLVIILSAPQLALARQHLWDVAEVYSNADGSIQYIEIFTASGFQDLLINHKIIANSDGTVMEFNIPSNLANTSTANQRVIFATPGFAALQGGIAADYTLPTAPFFDPGGDSVTISFSTIDSVTFTAGELPTDGIGSLNRDLSNLTNPDLMKGVNSPTNYVGDTGQLELIFSEGFETP